MNLESQKRILEKTGWNRGKSLANIPPIVLNKALKEITADYYVRHAALAFIVRIRKEASFLAAMLQEVTLMNSGAIHDLRNALAAMLTLTNTLQESSGNDLSIPIAAIEYATFLFETMAELRLKDGWNSFLYPVWDEGDGHIFAMIEKAIYLGQFGSPKNSFSIEPFDQQTRNHMRDYGVLVDKRQLIHAIAALLWSSTQIGTGSPVAVQCIHKSTSLQVIIQSPDWSSRALKRLFYLRQAEEGVPANLFMLVSQRMINRHGGSIHVDENALVVDLPYFEADQVESVVEELIAKNSILQTEQETLEPIQTGVSVTPLISLLLLELTRALEQIERLVRSDDLERVWIKTRYSQLIARNMLMASAGIQPQKGAFALAPLVDDLTNVLSDFLEECEVRVNVPLHLPDLYGDKTAMMQILVNLVTNAVEAMDGEGHLNINAESHPDGVVIQVADTGRGIPSADLDRVFDLFHTTKQGQERGVGLYVVKSLVKQLNGQVQVESQVGRGTVFTIVLPSVPQAATEKPNVLIVEDEVIFLEEYERHLAEDQHLYTLHTAKSVKTAREKYEQQRFDLVIADLKLRTRERGGLEILEEVKRLYPDTQVFILTGQGETEDAREAERLGVERYLTKPLEVSLLRQVIQSALRTQVDPEVPYLESLPRSPLPTPIVMRYNCQMMVELVNQAAIVAQEAHHILILGETGTGKGLLAEGIHTASGRATLELINCASLSEITLENILFGVETEKTGLLDRLAGGTLALDRISGLSIRLQQRLLETLTSQNEHQVDSHSVRIIAMDQHDLEIAVRQGLFLSALYQLLQQAVLYVPPLRERVDAKYKDVLILADHFLEKYTRPEDSRPRLSPQVENIFTIYPFPGNVAELEQVIRLALANLDDDIIKVAHLPPRLRRYGTRATLGVGDPENPVLCPHKPVLCNQTDVITNAFHQGIGLYLHLAERVGPKTAFTIEEKIKRLGLNPFPPEKIPDALTSMCYVCVPIQSSRYAILDISEPSPQHFYEMGLLHALGIPTLLICRTTSVMILESDMVTYLDDSDLPELIHSWLVQQVEL